MAFATALAEGPDDYPRRPSGPPPWIRRRLADTDPGALLPDPGAPGISGVGGIPGAPTWPGGR